MQSVIQPFQPPADTKPAPWIGREIMASVKAKAASKKPAAATKT